MRIALDPDLCQGHGVCESESPDVFSLGKEPPVTVLVAEPGGDLRPSVEAAVRFCPTHALSIVEEE